MSTLSPLVRYMGLMNINDKGSLQLENVGYEMLLEFWKIKCVSIAAMCIQIVFFVSCKDEATTNDWQLPESETCSSLFMPEMDAFQKSTVLRRYVAEAIVVGGMADSTLTNYYKVAFNDFKISIFKNKLDAYCGPANCGLAASMLVKLLNNNSIEAYTYNFGFDGTDQTHVVAVVKVSDNPEKWIIQDPFFNYTLVDTLGSPKDFLELLGELKSKTTLNIDLPKQDTIIRKRIVDLDKVDFSKISEDCLYFKDSVRNIGDSIKFFEIPICYSCIYNQPCSSMNFFAQIEKRLDVNGYPPEFFYSYQLQINELWGPHPLALQKKIDLVLGNE